jgi:hypothetical protein
MLQLKTMHTNDMFVAGISWKGQLMDNIKEITQTVPCGNDKTMLPNFRSKALSITIDFLTLSWQFLYINMYAVIECVCHINMYAASSYFPSQILRNWLAMCIVIRWITYRLVTAQWIYLFFITNCLFCSCSRLQFLKKMFTGMQIYLQTMAKNWN